MNLREMLESLFSRFGRMGFLTAFGMTCFFVGAWGFIREGMAVEIFYKV